MVLRSLRDEFRAAPDAVTRHVPRTVTRCGVASLRVRFNIKTLKWNVRSLLEFADYPAFVTSTRECAQVALSVFNDVATSSGLTINFSKTKLLGCGPRVSEADRRPLLVHDCEV